MKTTEPLSGPEPAASSREIASRLMVDSVLARLDGTDARLGEASVELARIPTLESRLDGAAARIDAAQARTEGLERYALGLASRIEGCNLRLSEAESAQAIRTAALSIRTAALEAEQARLRASLTSGRELLRLLIGRVRARVSEKVLGSPPTPSEPPALQSMLSRVKVGHLADAAESPGVMAIGSDEASTIESCRAIWPKAVFSEAAEPRVLRIAAGALPSGAQAIDASMLVIVDCTLTAGAGWTDSVREAIVFLAERGFASVDACVGAPGDAGAPQLSVAFVRHGTQPQRMER